MLGKFTWVLVNIYIYQINRDIDLASEEANQFWGLF